MAAVPLPAGGVVLAPQRSPVPMHQFVLCLFSLPSLPLHAPLVFPFIFIRLERVVFSFFN